MNAIIFSALWGVVMMFSGLLKRGQGFSRIMAIIGMALVFIVNLLELDGYRFVDIDVRGMLAFSTYSYLFNAVIFGCTLLYFIVSGADLRRSGRDVAEYFALMFFIMCGASIATSFNNMLMLFLSIEIISIPTYILAGIDKRNLKGNEAALKYFLMGAFSTGIMLMGIALIFGAKASFNLQVIAAGNETLTPLMSVGILLLLFSMAFKVSAAPFHFWTPDVYDGAPASITSFMATIVKIAAFAAFYRLFRNTFGSAQEHWFIIAAIITALTLFIGNITAVFQQSVKRMLAYSSIAQAGFMLFAIVSMNQRADEGILLYALAYSLATIGIFAVLVRLKDYTFDGFNGLAKHHPVLAATNAVFLLSLAGIPLTAGFMAKFYMLTAALQTGKLLWLVIIGIIGAAISVYYYFRVIQAMYFKDGEAQDIPHSGGLNAMLIVLAGLIVFIGIFPESVLGFLYYFL